MEGSAETDAAVVSNSGEGEAAGKYLTFKLAEEEYGLQILKVREIIGMMDVTPVPRTPDFIRGVINLRGKVIPVIEIRGKFKLDRIEDTGKTCIIVVQVERQETEVTMGIIVDEVSEVLDISPDQLEPSPEFGTRIDTDFILAIGKVNDKVIMLLDIDQILSSGELEQIGEAKEKSTSQ